MFWWRGANICWGSGGKLASMEIVTVKYTTCFCFHSITASLWWLRWHGITWTQICGLWWNNLLPTWRILDQIVDRKELLSWFWIYQRRRGSPMGVVHRVENRKGLSKVAAVLKWSHKIWDHLTKLWNTFLESPHLALPYKAWKGGKCNFLEIIDF